MSIPKRAILLAGFGMLTGTENTLFRYLWRHGAQVFLHVDPALAENGQGHWACTEQSNWIADWKADTVLALSLIHISRVWAARRGH